MTLQSERILPVLRGVFGPEVSVAAHMIGAASTPLTKTEAAAISRAVPARRAEFQAGRHAAKTALAKLGVHHTSIPMAKDRAPIWPRGFTGSISHSGGLAIASVAPRFEGRSLGLDMEPATPLEPELWDAILTNAERDWLETQPEAKQGIMAKIMFSIKECVYKAQYNRSGKLLNFDAFSTTISMESGAFQAVFQLDVPPFEKGQIISGSFVEIDNMILTATTL